MKKFLEIIFNTVRYIVTSILAIIALIFLVTIGSETTPMLVIEESNLYSDPSGSIATSDYVNKLHVVKQISEANS